MTRIPGTNGLPLVGSLLAYRQDRLAFLQQHWNQFGDISWFKLGSKKIHLITHPDDVSWVLQKNAKNYHKGTNLGEVLGQGILTSEDELWKKQRRTIAPIFHHEPVLRQIPKMEKVIQEMLANLPLNREVPMHDWCMRLAYRVMGEALFGAEIDPYFDQLHEATTFISHFLTARLFQVAKVPLSFPLPSHLKFRDAMKVFNRVVYQLIAEKTKNPADDLVSVLVKAKDPETGEGMSLVQIRDEVVTLLVAGHETTGHTLTWALNWIAKSPTIEEKIAIEAQSTAPFDPFANTYLSQVIAETLRLSPPVWAFTRVAQSPDTLRGVMIPKGAIIFVTPYFTHRHPEFWQQVEKFSPDRFNDRAESDSIKGKYIPFGMGPRQCIGKHFALMEVQLALGAIFKKIAIDRSYPISNAVPAPQVTMGIKGGLMMRFISRKQNEVTTL